MKIVIALASLGMLAACGDNDHHHHNPDAGNPDGMVIDAPTDAFVECNYTEQHDTTNDYLAVPGAVEESNVMFKTNSTRTICGTVNTGHFDNNFFSIDIDNYGVTMAQDGDVLVRLTGMAQNISQVGVFVADDADNGLGGGFFVGNHAVFSVHLAAGHYHFSVEAYDNQDATMSVPYEMRITTDHPTTRCAPATAAADYTESADGAANDQNDVVAIDYANNPRRELTGSTTDNPENTMLTIASNQDYRITGTSASVALQGSYFDRDTYLITTGTTTNELAIRLNWPGATADLDYYVFQEGTVTIPIANASKMMLGDDEFATFAVNTNSRYWLWVGAFQTSTGLPVTYDATVCPTTFP